MDFEYQGKTWLQKGFSFPGLYEYIETTRNKLAQSLPVPMYATAGESQHIQAVSEKIEKDPYLRRSSFTEKVKELNKSMTSLHSVSYGDHPMVYDVCVFATKQLMHMTPLIFLYTTDSEGYKYNAFAVDYQDKVWIYFSNQLFCEHGMLKEEELCYLVGHELGHAQCHHSTISSVNNKSNSDQEYSADRAGLIVCTQWIRQQHPEYTIEEAAKLAVLYSASALQKITVAAENISSEINWKNFDYDAVQNTIEHIFDRASKLTTSIGTHPHNRHRVMAMIHFSRSQLFYRCLGLAPDEYKNLYTDQMLQDIMAYQLVNG